LLLSPLILFRLRSRPGLTWLADPLSWIAYGAMGFFIISTSLLLLRDLLGLALTQLNLLSPATGPFIDLLTVTLAIAVTGWGFFQARRTPSVVEVEVPIAELPSAMSGLRIIQISDLHVGPTIKRPFVRKVVDRIKTLQADLIVFTGDLADGTTEQLGPDVGPLAELEAPLGVYFITGNHEYYSGVEAWTDQARSLGFDVLLNEGRLLEYGKGQVGLAGITDYGANEIKPEHASDPGKAFATIGAADLRILLAHQPRSIEAAHQAGCHLQLSGHTHGGQFVPWKYLIPLQQPFVAGLHKYRESWIYVHRGTGYWGPPLRLGAPSEIALITIRQASTP
jgi:predicted MPP superfamily phosphohydrolase